MWLLIITGRNEVVAKVMFLQVSVILLIGGAAPRPPTPTPPTTTPTPGQTSPRSDLPLNQTPPGQTPPPEADSGIRSTSGRYASYWNAFLLACESTWYIHECLTTVRTKRLLLKLPSVYEELRKSICQKLTVWTYLPRSKLLSSNQLNL